MLADNAFLSGADELAALKGAFIRQDVTGHGFIRSSQIPDALMELGRDPTNAAVILREFDPDGNGPVDFEQFIRIAAASLAPPRAPASTISESGAHLSHSSSAAEPAPESFHPSAVDALLEAPHPAFPGAGGDAGVSSAMMPLASGAGAAPGGFGSPGSVGGGGGHGGPFSSSASVGGGVGGIVGAELLLSEEGPDPKVEEFLRVLDEYRVKCEREGAYEEAGRATEQLAAMRKQEETRRIRALRNRHVAEKSDVLAAHSSQFEEFNAAWERYLAEFDAMASLYVAQMKERHDGRFKEFQDGLHAELMGRPVKFSRELLEWRTREATMARQRKYADAARVKALADELERRERRRLDEERLSLAAAREVKFRQTQAGELAALLKRIEARRAEHVKQKEMDAKRLLQRNRNVLAVLEQRHVLEEQRFTGAVKAALHPLRNMSPGGPGSGASAMARSSAGGAGYGDLASSFEAFSVSPSGGRPATQASGAGYSAATRTLTRGSAGTATAGSSGGGGGMMGGGGGEMHHLISNRLGLGAAPASSPHSPGKYGGGSVSGARPSAAALGRVGAGGSPRAAGRPASPASMHRSLHAGSPGAGSPGGRMGGRAGSVRTS